MKNHKKIGFFKIIKLIFYFIVICLIALNMFYAYQNIILDNPLPMLFGYGRAIVATNSMEPEIFAGDIVIIKHEKNYYSGDIVTYISPSSNSTVTHKIISIEGDNVITKGNVNLTPDAAFNKNKISGKVILILPKFGIFIDWLRQPFVMMCIFGGVVAIIFLPSFIQYFINRNKLKNKK